MTEIKIAGNSAAEALADLAELAKLVGLTEAPTKKRCTMAPPSGSVQERPPLSEAFEMPEPAAEAAPEPEPEAPAGDWEPGGGASVEEPIPAGTTLTLEEIRAAGVAAAKAHGKPAVQAILKDLGVPGMTALDPSQYMEFMRKLRELNAE